MRGSEKRVEEGGEEALVSHPSFNPTGLLLVIHEDKWEVTEWRMSLSLSFPLPILYLCHFLNIFLPLFPLSLSFSPPCLSPLSLPPGYRMKAGEAAPPPGEEEMKKDIFIISSVFPLSFKNGDIVFEHKHVCQIHHAATTCGTCAENVLPLRRCPQLTPVTPTLLQRKRVRTLKNSVIAKGTEFDLFQIFFKHKLLFK